MIKRHLFLRSFVRPSVLILLFLIVTGCATSETEVKSDSTAPKGLDSPQWVEGDSWVHHGAKGQIITEVEKVDESEMILRTGKIRSYYDPNLGLVKETSDDKLTIEYDPPYKGWRFFPLWVGKEWENHWTEKNHQEGSVSKFNERGKVVGWENIMTYAGASRALRIDLTRTNLGTQKRYSRTVWYSPEAKSFVRVTWKEMSERDQAFVEYKQKPKGSRPDKPVVAKVQPGSEKAQKEEKRVQKEERRISPDERLRKRLDEVYDLMIKDNYLSPEELNEVYDASVSDLILPAKLKILVDATDYDYLPFHPMFYLALEKEDYDDAELIRRNWVSWLYQISEFLGQYRHEEARIGKVIERAKFQIEKLEIVGFTDPLLIRLRKELTYALDARKWDDAQKIQSLIVSRTDELRSKQPREPRPSLAERGSERKQPPSVQASAEQPDKGAKGEEAQRSGADDMGKVLERIGGKLLKGKGAMSASKSSDSQAEEEGSSGYLTEDMIRALEVMKGKGTKKELTSKEKGTLQLIDVLLGVVKKK
jgi:hypothetical protein